MTQTLLILADDLTGAADTAARCREAGLPATIFLSPPTPPLPSGAVAFTSDSRHLSADEAAQRVQTVASALGDLPHAVWYKKIDSTLRGNLGSELEALLTLFAQSAGEQTAPPCAVISPGFPAQNRGLRDGRLVMAGSEAAAVSLPALLQQQTALPVTAIHLDDVRAGPIHLAAQLQSSYRQGHQLLVVDGLTEGDLRTLLAATQQALPHALLCGSAGLVGVLAQQMATQESTPGASDTAALAAPQTVLAVVGSGSSMAHHQIHAADQEPDVQVIQTELGDHPPVLAANSTKFVLHLPHPPNMALLDGPAARQLADHLSEVAQWVLAEIEPERLILVGGDTAIAVLERLGIQQLTVLRELLPGMPLTTGLDATGQERSVVLKAGNHGDAQTLVTLMRA